MWFDDRRALSSWDYIFAVLPHRGKDNNAIVSCHHTNSDMHIVQKRMFFKLMPNFYINVIFKNPLIKALVMEELWN